jgi:hypothetical protein
MLHSIEVELSLLDAIIEAVAPWEEVPEECFESCPATLRCPPSAPVTERPIIIE